MTATLVSDPPATGRPTALACLERVAATLGTSPEVRALHAVPPSAEPHHDGEALLQAAVRGDRLGDLWNVLDTLVQSEVGAVLPGWRDRSVPDALESVHLVPQDDHLVRLRVRAVPAGTPVAEPPMRLPDPPGPLARGRSTGRGTGRRPAARPPGGRVPP